MSLFTKIRCGLVLALPLTAISLFGVLGAQEPKRDQSKNNSPEGRPGQDRPGVPGANNNGPRDWNKGPMSGMGGKGWVNPMMPPKPDKELEAWIKILADKMTDRNDNIRNSARKALVSVGPAAMFSLKEMTESKDAATAVAAKNVMMEIGRSTMQQNMMMQKGGMPFGGPQGMPGMGWGKMNPQNMRKMPGMGWGKMNPQDMNRKAGPGGPPREGDQGNRPGAGRPEGDRKSGYGKGGSSREGDKNKRPEGRPETDPQADRSKGDRKGPPETGRPEGDRKGGFGRPPQNQGPDSSRQK